MVQRDTLPRKKKKKKKLSFMTNTGPAHRKHVEFGPARNILSREMGTSQVLVIFFMHADLHSPHAPFKQSEFSGRTELKCGE